MTSSIAVHAFDATDLARMRQALELFGEAFDDRATCCGNQPDDGYLASLLASAEWRWTLTGACAG
ncbi:MAG TPA: hypothetical protein VIL30_14675 [Ramlibacter sp.]